MLADVELVRVEHGAAVEVAGDDQQVAANVLPAGRGQPVGTAALHQLDEPVLLVRQVPAEGLLLVGRIDGDGADRARLGAGIRAPDRGKECEQEQRFHRHGHGTAMPSIRHVASRFHSSRKPGRRLRAERRAARAPAHPSPL